ncbi:MAG: nicotinate-nucleotide adenylyltransferase [Candidatus Omnitrophota bacterium]
MKTRVGLLGGTFNPIHRGHIDLGMTIRDAFALDQIYYILAARPPHKTMVETAPVSLRWAMLQEALTPFPYFQACDIEMKRDTYSWTIDTVAELKHLEPETDFYFISGSEGFLKIRTWKDYRTLLRMVSFIVILRDASHCAPVEALLKDEGIPPCVEVSRSFASSENRVYVFSYPSDKLGISSTAIRQKIKLSEPIDQWVNEGVKKIMEENHLYGFKN